jgi:EAL domain-containing protein (putative c-di-GMP-specific phosphodiesterase class I)
MVSQVLTDTGFDPKSLCLEITESLLIHNISQVTLRLKSITMLGVSFSIDDFGTGYSSMSYLQRLPIHEVKIDRAFVKNLSKNNGDMVIVKTIYAMASSLGMQTVAEGVEDQLQLNALREIGVEIVQGYHCGRPMPESVFSEHLDASKRESRIAA